MRVLLHLLLIGLVMLAIGQARALAQPAPAADKTKVAKQYVDAGLAAQGTGDYDTALTMYAKAYELVPHPVLLFNMAQAHRLAGHIDQALTLYARYLAEDPNGAQAQTARELVTELKARKAKPTTDTAGDDGQPGSGAKRVARPPRNEPSDDGSTGGTLVVKARNQRGAAIDDGTVMVDEEPRGRLASGRLTVPQVAEGRHTVAIEAGDYRRFEEAVTVHDGERAHLDALLIEKAAPSPSPQRTVWKVSLGVSLAVAVAGGAFAVYGYHQVNVKLGPDSLQLAGESGASVSADNCDKPYQAILDNSNPKVTSFNYAAFRTACTWRSRIYVGYAISGVGLLGAVVSLIMLTRDNEPPDTPASGTRGKKPSVAIAPIVMPGGGGASLSLTW